MQLINQAGAPECPKIVGGITNRLSVSVIVSAKSGGLYASHC